MTQGTILNHLSDEHDDDSPITDAEIDRLADELEASRSLIQVGQQQTISPEVFEAIKARGQMYTSYTGVKPVALEDYINRTIVIRGFVVQELSNTDEDTGVVTSWQDLRLKLESGEVISCSGKAARAFARLLMQMGLPQGDWPSVMQVLVQRRKLNTTTKDQQPKYMPVFQIVG